MRRAATSRSRSILAGGKTHTLITLYHLTRDPASLPDLPSVQEFIQHIGRTPPKTSVVVLPFNGHVLFCGVKPVVFDLGETYFTNSDDAPENQENLEQRNRLLLG